MLKENFIFQVFLGQWLKIELLFYENKNFESKMVDNFWKGKINPLKIAIMKVFDVASLKFNVSYSKYKMVKPIWRTIIQKLFGLFCKLLARFLALVITNFILVEQN